MFRSATLRLTGCYLLILMLLSITFSFFIYQVANSEVQVRLERFQTKLQQSQDFGLTPPPINRAETLRLTEQEKASTNLSIELLYINLSVIVLGGVISYFLARRTLMPIEKAHAAQSRFTSDASHELRTPLAAMKTEIEVAVKDNTATAEDLRKILSSNLEEVDKLSKLSEMLLNLSRPDTTKLKFGPVYLNKIAHDVINDFKQPHNRIHLTSRKQLMVHGNDTAIADLIKILIDNALQYSPNDSKISITISKQDDQAKFEVTNTGPGIESDKLPYIFDRFYRADSSRTNNGHKGYGLGLALAKNIVESHNGRLIATSTPDVETIFTVLLPLHSLFPSKN